MYVWPVAFGSLYLNDFNLIYHETPISFFYIPYVVLGIRPAVYNMRSRPVEVHDTQWFGSI
jgi:hypothetical protein